MNKCVLYYKEWLKLKRQDFRIMNMLALSENSKFTGNLTDLCKRFSLSPQDNNRKRIKKSIELLEENNFITVNRSGRTYILNVIPKETEIEVKKDWIETILSTKEFSESISKEAVIKCLLWLLNNKEYIITDKNIAEDLDCCIDTITKAKNVLQNDFNLILKTSITEKINNYYRRKGQHIDINAWINKRNRSIW